MAFYVLYTTQMPFTVVRIFGQTKRRLIAIRPMFAERVK